MSLVRWYHYFNTEVADPKGKDWFLVSSPVPVLVLILSYLYFVLKCGPKFMENRKPYSFKTFIKFYNLFQIVTNALIIYHIFDAGWYEDYFFYCTEVDYTINPKTMKFATVGWYLLVLKLIDFIETGVFVLRKKQRQISFLHLYHHVSTVLLSWMLIKYFVNGMTFAVPLVNCGVHVIMYTYYLLASFGPEVQRYLNPVKPMITIIQMVQFIGLILFSMQAFIPGCKDVKLISGITVANLLINFYLFYQFYQQNYVKKDKKSKTS